MIHNQHKIDEQTEKHLEIAAGILAFMSIAAIMVAVLFDIPLSPLAALQALFGG